MVVLTIETFKTDKITTISVDDKSSGGSNYKSVKFAYDGGEVPLIRIDGDYRLFRFRNKVHVPNFFGGFRVGGQGWG